jgi:hypothetical protein
MADEKWEKTLKPGDTVPVKDFTITASGGSSAPSDLEKTMLQAFSGPWPDWKGPAISEALSVGMQPRVPRLTAELHRASWESEFQKRLDAENERTRKQSPLRRSLIRWLSAAASAALRMVIRLDK